MDDKEKDLEIIGNRKYNELKKEYLGISSVSALNTSTFKVYGTSTSLLKLQKDGLKKELKPSFESDGKGTPYLLLK
ncbi:hypothetical protein [Methanobacterium paludis]|uniref:Uncharacterized protein n=1 Tax=Methanobacterium paludis (strain DSM 25820 / JCM 18151 / SWAN1) TaxID=868131 RepID=F6D347_METPW|nr:hypothetical protein [Methanobacterium paludis]AEG17987.1 hypothetical protein MSWAN_0963 [Methanobacterium paludis]